MINYRNRQKALIRLILIATFGAMYFSWLLYMSASAQSNMLLRLWHDQDANATVTDGDMPAAGVEVTVTEQCTVTVCAASPRAYVVVTDNAGYASLELQTDTQYSIDAPCLSMEVTASDVGGQAVQEVSTCKVWRVWLMAIFR
jgi:hypothetical protein